MKQMRLFCLILALILLAVGCKKKEPEQPEEVKVIAESEKQRDRPSKSLHLAAAAGDMSKQLLDRCPLLKCASFLESVSYTNFDIKYNFFFVTKAPKLRL